MHVRAIVTHLKLLFICIFLDIEECKTVDKCKDGATCIEFPGTYSCSCATGKQYNFVTDTCDGELLTGSPIVSLEVLLS